MQRDILDRALTSMRSEPRIGPHFRPQEFTIDPDGMVTIEAEVESVAQKRLTLERIAAVRGVSGIIDRLHVRPAVPWQEELCIIPKGLRGATALSYRAIQAPGSFRWRGSFQWGGQRTSTRLRKSESSPTVSKNTDS